MSDDLKRFKLVHDPEYQSQMLRRADGNWTPYDEAAAEITRLRAQVEAADKLAVLTARISVGLHQTAKDRDLSEGELAFMNEADAALATYQEKREGGE